MYTLFEDGKLWSHCVAQASFNFLSGTIGISHHEFSLCIFLKICFYVYFIDTNLIESIMCVLRNDANNLGPKKITMCLYEKVGKEVVTSKR